MAAIDRPGLSLRLAFAGRRDLGGNEASARAELDAVFRLIEARVAAIARPQAGRSLWYGPETPRVTLVTGLADGADQLAAELFAGRSAAGEKPPVDRLLGTVLPFGAETYIAASPIADVARFRTLLESSAYVIALPDGGASAGLPDAETQIAAYRAQAEIILRQADILVAVLDDTAGKPGGSRETVGRALAAGIPVVRFMLGVPGAVVLRRTTDLDIARGDLSDPDWQRKLGELIDELLLPAAVAAHAGHGKRSGALLDEFCDAQLPRPKPRQRLWTRFDRLFRRRPRPVNEPVAGAMQRYWARATALSHHYATLYRGTFLVSYSLAMVAVALAVTALTVLAVTPATVDAGYDTVAVAADMAVPGPVVDGPVGEAAVPTADAAAAGEGADYRKPHRPYSVWWILFGLGLIEFLIVSRIFLLTRAANRGQWSELAADYRHLAEGLRAMAYLPLAGSFRPPSLPLGPYAMRASSMNVIDRMLQAIARSTPPATLLPAARAGSLRRLDPASALAAIRGKWIQGQIDYHAANADTMRRMSEHLAAVARISAAVVVAIVPIDLVLVFLHALKLTLPGFLDSATPYLLWATAILPAIIAGVNGLRSQSECTRLADRSEHLRRVLENLAARIDRREVGEVTPVAATAGALDVVLVVEEMARLMLDEVTDWSALYSKDLAEA